MCLLFLAKYFTLLNLSMFYIATTWKLNGILKNLHSICNIWRLRIILVKTIFGFNYSFKYSGICIWILTFLCPFFLLKLLYRQLLNSKFQVLPQFLNQIEYWTTVTHSGPWFCPVGRWTSASVSSLLETRMRSRLSSRITLYMMQSMLPSTLTSFPVCANEKHDATTTRLHNRDYVLRVMNRVLGLG